VFWHNVDPLDRGGQFCDRGNQYRTAIFYHDAEQQRLAEQSKQALEASGKLKKKIVTEIVPAGEFYAAEDYHQEYYIRNPIRYKYYRFNCGRDDRLKQLWGERPRTDQAGGRNFRAAASARARAAHPSRWSFTRPMACMNA
jgi:peptide-methionine (S)-S-oxide reductase